MLVKTYNLTEFQKEAEKFVLSLTPAVHGATVVGLYGDLGAGKTTFVQAVAKALGITETVNSPTFLIVKSYKLPFSPSTSLEGEAGRGCFKTVVHVDAYRLKSSEELRKLHFSELLADPRNLILVEWADRVADILPKDHTQLHFEFVDDQTRKISFS